MVYTHRRKIVFNQELTHGEVLFKKSPVDPLEPPLNHRTPPDTEVWVIPETQEAFISYDEYLYKIDYYRQRVFSCEITGHGHLTYFDALKSEANGVTQIESAFPQALREPVLRKVQHQQIGRLEQLVNFLYDSFSHDIQINEIAHVEADDSGVRLVGRVKEKTSFAGTSGKAPINRYFVELENEPRTALVDDDHIFRPPRTFSKQLLRSFLRHTVWRENFDNAPWLLKESVATEHDIDNTLPRHLTQDAIQAWRKVQTALEKSKVELSRVIPKRVDDFEAMTRTIIEHKGKMPTDLVTRYAQAHKAIVDPASVPTHASMVALLPAAKASNASSTAAAAVEIKYPREDLEVKPKPSKTRPNLKFHQQDRAGTDPEVGVQDISSLTSGSVGKALSIWSTLNIHSKFFVLDSFTYDDFITAMLYNSEEIPCELFEEIHCAILKSLVNRQGETEAMIPSMNDLSLSSNSSSKGTSSPSTPKRSASTANEAAEADLASGGSSPLSDVDQNRFTNGASFHNAKAMLNGYDWIARIKDRAFENGGWQVTMIGLLYHLSQVDWIDNAPNRILTELAPLHQAATADTARKRYAELDVNLRLAAIECAIMLACTSKAFKESMEVRAAQQTTDRKDKTDAQRRRKPLLDELTKLDTDRKMTRPEDYDEPQTNGHADPDEMDVDGSEPDMVNDSEQDDTDSEPMRGRRRSGRASDLKRRHEQLTREKEAKVAQAAAMAQNTERAEYERIVASCEAKRAEIRACEEEIAIVDGKLRENSCHRTRILGIDRFCNRYWWFERNGMPFLGHEESSTADYGYLNGRLWVQGPGALERDGFFNISAEEAAKYEAMSGDTPVHRRSKEQGDTVLMSDTEWGYYSTADELRALTGWLDERGDRERKLLKEISRWRADIFMTMEARSTYLQMLEQKRLEATEEPTGVATRKKGHSERDKLKHPCLAWTNGEALRHLGHLHSEGQGRKAPRGVATRPKAHSGFIAVNQKRETRQGTRY